jgi:hypothetical protein
VGARQLRAHVDDASVEVDVVPDEAEHLGDPQARVEHGRDHEPLAGRADREQALYLGAAEHPLATTLGPRALVVFEPLDRVGDDPAAAAGEAHDALERPERARRGLRRAALAAQSMQQLGDVVDRDRRKPPRAERRQEMAVEVVAVRFERARMALARRYLGLEALKPPADDSVEPQLRRDRRDSGLRGCDKRQAFGARLCEIGSDRPIPEPPRTPAADCVFPVWQQVDPALHAHAAPAGASSHRPASFRGGDHATAARSVDEKLTTRRRRPATASDGPQKCTLCRPFGWS